MRLAGIVALTGTLALIAAAPAAAATPTIDAARIDGSALKFKSFNTTVPGNTGGKIRCPKNKRILNGGAFWHETGAPGPDPAIGNQVQLTSSAPLGGRTWYADGRNNASNPRTLTVEIRCLPKAQLRAVESRSKSKLLKSGFANTATASCPKDFATISGGAYLAEPGDKGPKPGVSAERGRITGSTPGGIILDKWFAVGGNFSDGKLVLKSVVHCYPDTKVQSNAYYTHPVVNASATGGGYWSCPGGAALTGGVFWTEVGGGSPLAKASSTFLSGNAVTFQVDGIYAAGLNNSSTEAAQLSTMVICPA